ncbi:MAG: hypothetical protein K2K64_05375, partial [Muribaculaceae bacterium]|nr:hypothetical protein [Muribaculaceae bacterium]
MNLFKFSFISCCSVLCFLGSACSSDSNEPADSIPNKRADINLSETSRGTSIELLDFYTNFTNQAIEINLNDVEKTNKNTVVSPLSAAMLLGMMSNGIDSETEAKKIALYLGVSDLDAVNELSRTLLQSLPSVDNQSKIALGNSIRVNKRFTLSDAFASTMQKDNFSEISYDDFSNQNALLAAINDWCNKQTGGLIPNAIKKVSASDMAILINTMFFKSKWANSAEFDPQNTKKGVFHGYNSDTNVDFMVSERSQRLYGVSPNFSSCVMNFGNGAFSLYLVLPDERMTPDNIATLYNKEEAAMLSESSQRCSVRIEIPKFKITGNIDINKILEKAGAIPSSSSYSWSMFTPAEAGAITMTQTTSFEIDENGA